MMLRTPEFGADFAQAMATEWVAENRVAAAMEMGARYSCSECRLQFRAEMDDDNDATLVGCPGDEGGCDIQRSQGAWQEQRVQERAVPSWA